MWETGTKRAAWMRVLLVLALFCISSATVWATPEAPEASAGAAAAAPEASVSPEPAGQAQPAAPASQAPQQPPSQPTLAVNPVTQAAVKAGVLTCTPKINQVMTFLTAGCKSHAYLFVGQSQPDRCIFSVSLSTQSLEGKLRYSSASFAPTTNGRASAVYDSVEYVDQTPEAVEKSMFGSLKRKGSLGKDTIILDGGYVTVFLMPAGTGCIVIKKEVVQ